MALTVKGLMKDKTVLYIVLFFAITNVIGFLMMHNVEAVLFFVVIGMLTSYFTKNMIIVLLTALVATNALVGARRVGGLREGMTDGEEDDKEHGDKKKVGSGHDDTDTASHDMSDTGKDSHHDASQNSKEAMSGSRGTAPSAATSSQDEEESGRKPRLDHAATLSAAYDNLDKILGSDAINKMSADSAGLAAQQQKLLGSLDKLEPMIQRASNMLDGLGAGTEKITSMMGKLGSLSGTDDSTQQ